LFIITEDGPIETTVYFKQYYINFSIKIQLGS